MIQYKLSKNVGTKNVTKYEDQYVFGYPCPDNQYDCSPYTVSLDPGRYLFEAWGARGGFDVWATGISVPGLGGYTSGILKTRRPLTVYLYVGSTSFFNSIFFYKGSDIFVLGGASSDVRLYANKTFDWSNPLSLRSRIMVSGGGGGAEWEKNTGGNGGGLQGGSAKSDCTHALFQCPGFISGGGSQTSGGTAAPTMNKVSGIPGLFGMSPMKYSSPDFGAVGGNGYYSGASIDFAGAAGGGSSFISGHKGCIALNGPADETPSPSNSPIHYSGLLFTRSTMIQGNKSMPLYYSPKARGIGNKGRGAIRITILPNEITSENHYIFRSDISLVLYLGFSC